MSCPCCKNRYSVESLNNQMRAENAVFLLVESGFVIKPRAPSEIRAKLWSYHFTQEEIEYTLRRHIKYHYSQANPINNDGVFEIWERAQRVNPHVQLMVQKLEESLLDRIEDICRVNLYSEREFEDAIRESTEKNNGAKFGDGVVQIIKELFRKKLPLNNGFYDTYEYLIKAGVKTQEDWKQEALLGIKESLPKGHRMINKHYELVGDGVEKLSDDSMVVIENMSRKITDKWMRG